MNVKNLKRDLADMGYRPFEVSYNEISLYFRSYSISYVLKWLYLISYVVYI